MLRRRIISTILCLALLDFQGLSASISDSRNSQKSSFLKHVESKALSSWLTLEGGSPSISPESPFVLLIRDLHGDYEAQMNIAKAIEFLAEDSSKLPLVLVEGATDEVDTSFFGTFPDIKVRKTLTKDFVKQGWVTGPEYLSITRYGEKPFLEIWGVEDASLYVENFKNFREVLSETGEIEDWFLTFGQVLETLKNHIYHPELLELDKAIRGRLTGEIDLEAYVEYLLQKIRNPKSEIRNDVDVHPNLSLFQKILGQK